MIFLRLKASTTSGQRRKYVVSRGSVVSLDIPRTNMVSLRDTGREWQRDGACFAVESLAQVLGACHQKRWKLK